LHSSLTLVSNFNFTLMENQELLNPESGKNKKDTGVENLNTTNESSKSESSNDQVNDELSPEPETEQADSSEISSDESSEKSEEITEENNTEAADTEEITAVDTPVSDTPLSDNVADTEKTDAQAPAEKEASSVVSDDLKSEDTDVDKVVEESKSTVSATEESAPDDSEKQAPSTEKEEEKVDAVILPNEGEDDSEDSDDSHDHDDDDEDKDDLTARYGKLQKAELVEAIEALVLHEDIAYIRKHISHIKVAFRNYLKEHSVDEYEKSLSDGTHQSDEKPVDELAERFDKAFSVYREKKSLFDQALERQKHDNLLAKESILEDLRNLIESEEELKKTYDVFKELQEKWREIGPVPQNSKNTLWNNYHFLVEKFFDKVKINKELRDLDLRKNLEVKTELCEKAEELLLETSVNKSFQKLQKLHDAWKETGPVPKDKKDEIWDRFKAASDALNERRQSYYDSLREEQSKNLAAKVLLCEQAEQFVEFTSDSPRKWQDATDKINELFKVWKSVGFAPKKLNDEVWVRFRTALDGFFRNKKDFFFKYKDDQTENYNQKLNLCLQAEALKDSEDWKHTTDELIALQQQWKKIGPVPRKFSDKVWKRFRTACDEFFNRKSAYFNSMGEKQDENLQKKRELIEAVKNYGYSDDNNENLNVLKDFQRQWMEIGHVPIKEKDKIQNEFRKLINEQFDKLNISRKAKSTMGFKNKVENIKGSPNADNILYKEKSVLVNKISSLQNDIKLWENNIGFFASSKKADVLKMEFEKKIEKAKADIAIMEEKLKILNAS